MNMPCMSKTAYYKQVENIVNEQENEAKEEMKRAVERLRKTVLSENEEEDQSQVVDVTVSFDGIWAKCGFTSLTGVVVVISLDTGEALDSHVLCKSCSKCAIKKSRCNDEKEFRIGGWSTRQKVNVTSILLGVHQPWRLKGLLFYGADL